MLQHTRRRPRIHSTETSSQVKNFKSWNCRVRLSDDRSEARGGAFLHNQAEEPLSQAAEEHRAVVIDLPLLWGCRGCVCSVALFAMMVGRKWGFVRCSSSATQKRFLEKVLHKHESSKCQVDSSHCGASAAYKSSSRLFILKFPAMLLSDILQETASVVQYVYMPPISYCTVAPEAKRSLRVL